MVKAWKFNPAQLTVVLLDNLWLSVTGLLGTIGGVLCGFWAFAAIAFGLAMLGLSK